MMQKRLLSLLLITVAVLGIGLILSQRQQPVSSDGRSESGPLVPALASALNDVSSLRIVKAKDELVAELTRTESGWVVSNRHNYPADMGKVRAYLIKLSEAKLREAKTSKPENYARIGVEDVSAEGANSVAVELGGLKEPVRLIVGMASGGGSPGTFVRRAGEAESWLVTGDVIPDKEGPNWLAREVLDVPSADIHSVTVTAPDKSVLKIDKADPAAFNYAVQGVPKGRALSSESAANAIAGVLSSVTLEDALPIAEATPDPASTWQATFAGYDGLVVDLTLWDKDTRSWAKFAARLDEARLDAWVAAEKTKADAARAQAEAAASAAKPADETEPAEGDQPADPAVSDAAAAPAIPEPFDADKARADKRAALDARIAEINAKTSPWVYAIPNWKTANVKKKMEDLLAPKG